MPYHHVADLAVSVPLIESGGEQVVQVVRDKDGWHVVTVIPPQDPDVTGRPWIPAARTEVR